MMGGGDTLGVFQLEGQGMRDTLRKGPSRQLEDVIAIISLYRPGPMDNIPVYIEGKENPEGDPVSAPDLKPDPGSHVWRPGLSGAGDADGAGNCRLFARRCRLAAPRHG
jgi:hypothetical protein